MPWSSIWNQCAATGEESSLLRLQEIDTGCQIPMQGFIIGCRSGGSKHCCAQWIANYRSFTVEAPELEEGVNQ